MLFSKISESIGRINQNTNLTILNSNLNNSLNKSILKHDGLILKILIIFNQVL